MAAAPKPIKEMSGTEYSIFRRNQAKEKAQNGNQMATVRVIVRKRPVQEGERDFVEVQAPLVLVNEDKLKVDLTKFTQQHTFTYDDSFGEFDDTQELFQRSIYDLVVNVLDGGTSTAFCFGQTASGKVG
jgi:kinesin family protein 2/24